MAAQNMMRLGGGGLRRQGMEALLWGQIKMDLINQSPSGPADSVQVQAHCVAIGGHNLCGWPGANDWCLSAPRLCSSQPWSAFVVFENQAATVTNRSHLSGCVAMQRQAWWICCRKSFHTYSLLIKALRDFVKKIPLTSTFSWLAPCPSDVFLSFLSPQASL